ncbi:MAG: hypothetical protein M1287_00290 [Firmicutes bacterium]|nr:hypothetical protein [Bacillota bacterium]
MRDRTMIILALLFLTLTVGVGVNKSLAACNTLVGKPMAPGIGEMYRRQVPLAVDQLEKGTRYGKSTARMITRSYPVAVKVVERVKTRAESEIKAGLAVWRQWYRNTFNNVGSRARYEKI